jgi:uncharacterized protein
MELMKKYFIRYQFVIGMIIFIALLFFSILIANIIFSIPLQILHIPNTQQSIEISSRSIVALLMLCSTMLVYAISGKKMGVALQLSFKKMHLVLTGFIIGLLVMLIIILLNCPLYNLKLVFNPDVNYQLLLGGFLLILPGVILEELLFRGYPFLQTKQKTNTITAIIVFGMLFIFFHCYQYVFSGNYGRITGTLMTGVWHILFAVGILKTGSLYMPMGFHIGTNWASQFLINGANMQLTVNEKNNKAIFYVVTNMKDSTATQTVLTYLISIGCILIAAWLIWKYYPQAKPTQ